MVTTSRGGPCAHGDSPRLVMVLPAPRWYERPVKPVTVLFPALALWIFAGCSGASMVQQGPSDTLRSYAQALEQGRVEDAYRLLSDEAKRTMTLVAFRRAVQENPADAAEIARALARPATDPIVTATVTIPNGDELLLVFEGGRWRIDASAVDLYGQATPRQAILGFLRAFERRRYDVVLRYVPQAEREGAVSAGQNIGLPTEAPAAQPDGGAPPAKATPTSAGPIPGDGTELTAAKLKLAWEGAQKEQINRIVQAIKAALPTAQIEETGDNAAMPYGAGGTVAFVREHGAWKIRDF